MYLDRSNKTITHENWSAIASASWKLSLADFTVTIYLVPAPSSAVNCMYDMRCCSSADGFVPRVTFDERHGRTPCICKTQIFNNDGRLSDLCFPYLITHHLEAVVNCVSLDLCSIHVKLWRTVPVFCISQQMVVNGIGTQVLFREQSTLGCTDNRSQVYSGEEYTSAMRNVAPLPALTLDVVRFIQEDLHGSDRKSVV